MLFKSQVYTQVSGSVGGTTYAHNASGMYARARSIPVNPASSNQLQVRSALTDAVTRWIDTLTAAQRDGWAMYAENVPVINPLGDPILLSGQNWYIAANTPRLQAIAKLTSAIARVDDAPTIFDRSDFTTPSGVTAIDALAINFTIDNTDAWANEDGAAMLVFMGAPQNPSVNFFKGPYRLIAAVEGDSVTPPINGQAVTQAVAEANGFPYTSGQNIWLAFAVTRADGRLTTRRNVGPILST